MYRLLCVGLTLVGLLASDFKKRSEPSASDMSPAASLGLLDNSSDESKTVRASYSQDIEDKINAIYERSAQWEAKINLMASTPSYTSAMQAQFERKMDELGRKFMEANNQKYPVSPSASEIAVEVMKIINEQGLLKAVTALPPKSTTSSSMIQLAPGESLVSVDGVPANQVRYSSPIYSTPVYSAPIQYSYRTPVRSTFGGFMRSGLGTCGPNGCN